MSNSRSLSLKGVKFARMDDYFGLWAIDEMRGLAMFDRIRQMNLVAHVAESRPQRRGSLVKTETLTPSSASNEDAAIAVIRLDGTMMKHASSIDDATSTVRLRQDIRAAANNPLISGILLVIDSPGGSVSGTADLAREVRSAAAKKPVHAFVEDLCASAAYWVMSQCDVAYANDPTALVGSIGTFIGLYDVSKMAEKEGVAALVFKTGSIKGAGFPGTPVTEEQKAYFQSIVDQTQTHFSSAVAEGRELTDEEVANVATGGVFMAEEAVKLGLIDGIKTYEQAVIGLFESINTVRDSRSAAHRKEPIEMTKPSPKSSDTPKPVEEPKKPEEQKPADEQKPSEPAKPTDESKPADATTKPETEKPAAAAPGNDRASEGARFKAAFGNERGAAYFADGLTFEQAGARYTEDLNADLAAANARLAAIDRGEEKPVSVAPEKPKSETAAKSSRLEQNLGKGLGAFAASIKLPSNN